MPRRSRTNTDTPLLVIVLDVSPMAWGERDLQRQASDKARGNKRSIGPCVLSECVESLEALVVAFASVNTSSNGVVVIGVADNQVETIFPRDLQTLASTETSQSLDLKQFQQEFVQGLDKLVDKTVKATSEQSLPEGACMAAGFSMALCIIQRLILAARSYSKGSNTSTSGIIALLDDHEEEHDKGKADMGWAPRIFMVQASPDRSRDYNAFMNCTFCAVQQNITVDACFFKSKNESSAFLEQAVDLTGGLFLGPSGSAQVGGALTTALQAVFLATERSRLHLPSLGTVDFRARSFDTGNMVDQAYVCNQCLSIFEAMPSASTCPTCGADIVVANGNSER